MQGKMNERINRDRGGRDERRRRNLDTSKESAFQISRVGDASILIPDPFVGLGYRSANETIRAFAVLLTEWYQNACAVASAVVSDIKTLWIITSGSYLHKGKVVGKLVFYYLIVLAIYMIETSFWMNKRIIEILANVVVEARGNIHAMIGLGIFFGILFIAFLLGGTITSSPCEG